MGLSDGPPIPWWDPVLGGREKELVGEVIDSNFPNDGEYTTRFETQVAALLEVEHAVAVTSGTVAIFLGLLAAGVQPGDDVIVPDVTFIATANAVRLAGANPVLVDVERESFNVDPASVEARLTSRTTAIVPVHVSGRGAAIEAIRDLARRKHVAVVEDAAEALASWRGRRALGTFGDAGCFSFSPNKTITTGQGGMVVTRSGDIAARLRGLKDHGRPVRGTGGADEHPSLGYNFKLTNLQAAIGLAQLEQFAARQARLRRTYALYRDGLTDVPSVRLPGFDLEGGECPQWVDASVEGRDELHDYLLARGVHTRKFWHPLHTQAPYRRDGAEFPASDDVSARGLWLPSALSLTDSDIERVCDHVRTWAKSR